jgi:hypothetical protein
MEEGLDLIACSSRSRARPVGRWQLQLSLRWIRHTCEESHANNYFKINRHLAVTLDNRLVVAPCLASAHD